MARPNRSLNPKTTERDFFGVPGALAISIGLPLVTNLLYFACNENGCPVSYTSLQPYKASWNGIQSLISLEALYAYLAWFLGLVLVDRIVPGKVVKGTKLRDGTSLEYKFNGTAVVILLGTVLSARFVYTNGAMPELVFLYDNLLEVINSSILLSFVIAIYVYLRPSFAKTEPLLAEGGNTGNVIFDWFIGRELNPRIGDFDIKVFCEMRPGLLMWILVNLSMAHHQYLKYGSVSDSMILVVLFEGYYVVEGTIYEDGLINMMDVTMDGLGFMLSFGDLALVPFTYTVQSRYLANNPIDLGLVKSLVIIGVYITGMLIFRLANNQKGEFKAGSPSTKHLKYIQTPTGSKLITSGWWGMSRHINYFGDWIVAWAYCLPTGFNTPIPYWYVLFFGILLVHREMRDDAKCANKYKQTWNEYKKIVPWKIIPYVY